MAAEQQRLTTLYKNATDCIPVLLDHKEGLPVSEIYAPLLMEEDLDAMKRTRRPDEPSGSKTLDSVRDVFFICDRDGGEISSTRILMKGEAGSGKSVFCLKLVESWRQLLKKVQHEHEKHSELICQLWKDWELPELLRQSQVWYDQSQVWCERNRQRSLPDFRCSTCELQEYLKEFDLLYYVTLRDATEGKILVLDLVCDAVCNDRQNLIDRTKRLLSDDNVRCMIVLDGVDEWPNPPGFTELPNTRGLSDKCVLLWTMRPWKLVHLQLKPKHDDHIVTVSGLSPYSAAQAIENILAKFYGLNGRILKSTFLAYCTNVTDNKLEGIMQMPMMLTAACHLWCEEDKSCAVGDTKSFSKTHLYLSLLEQMIKRAVTKQREEENPQQNAVSFLLTKFCRNIFHLIQMLLGRSPSNLVDIPFILTKFHHISRFNNMLLPFCELAFTDLISEGRKLVFQKGYLELQMGQSQVNLAYRVGLISQAKLRSNLNSPQNVSVSFYHRSVQELLAAVYMTCGNPDAVTSFCGYCSTLERVMETANVTMFVMGLDPSLGCRICEHITSIVNNDPDITEYRRTLERFSTGEDRVRQLYRTQCEWYRELTHVRTVTGDTSPPPSLHLTDIYLDITSDSDTVRLTGDLMSANLGRIVSVSLWHVEHPLHGVVQNLPQCPNLTALYITYRSNKENLGLLVAVIPRLTQLTTVRYDGYICRSDAANYRAAVAAVMSLTQLVSIQLDSVSLGDDGVRVTDAMTRLRTVVLGGIGDVSMTAAAWDRFVTSLLTLPQSVSVRLDMTDIDKGTVRRIQTSPRVTVTKDKGKRDEYGRYERLEFTTVPSQMA